MPKLRPDGANFSEWKHLAVATTELQGAEHLLDAPPTPKTLEMTYSNGP